MKKVVLMPNPTKDTELKVTGDIAKRLKELDFAVYVEQKFVNGLNEAVIGYSDFPGNADFIVVVGGDGSVIDASRFAVEYDVPLLGVNLGKVGYLTEIDPQNLDLLSHLKTGKYKIEEKMLLEASIESDGGVTVLDRLAVNDVVVSHNAFLGISEFEVENEDGDSIKYRADGIIASTPVGSTAYSLSSGGPVVSHNVDTILLTPVSPHSFFNRSILFNSEKMLKIKNVNKDDLSISIDGRFCVNLSTGDVCRVKRSERRMRTVHFASGDMFSTLFKKMRILEDI